ncbi:class II glutamine amidotransferase [Nocardia barduliensis]|uniref:class II glutamine amidotransferase n=1 Tax=Nocardia barduliensis TaxID=2736643 RepID=UPI0015729821|nr:class II glutamine amidotransferase [Nocardia barduliensis]
MAYSGQPILVQDLLFRPEHSLIDQSLHSSLGETTTNGDGFGIGWYGEGAEPAVYKSIEPAWNDSNLREIAKQVRTPIMLAHVRSSTGTAVQRSNCHPFRYGQWLWVHNGVLRGFQKIRRDLLMAVDPDLFPYIEGSTDTEALFYLAMTFGLVDDPFDAVARAVGFVEDVGHTYDVDHPVQMTVATTDGESLWVFRYSSERHSRSLFFSTEISQLRALHPEVEVLRQLGAETRFVVSEPLRDLEGAWNEVPESAAAVVGPGTTALRPFAPIAPG